MSKKKDKKLEGKRARVAAKSLKEIEEKLEPFIRKTPRVNTSTAGQWEENVGWLDGIGELEQG